MKGITGEKLMRRQGKEKATELSTGTKRVYTRPKHNLSYSNELLPFQWLISKIADLESLQKTRLFSVRRKCDVVTQKAETDYTKEVSPKV